MSDAIDDLDTFSWIGWDDYGAVDRIESEAIVTSFFSVIIPVWPSHSVYVSRATDGEEQRIEIPLHRRSVILGYLRVPTWLAALIFTLPAFIDPERWLPFLGLGLGFAAIASLLTFVAGRLPAPEQRRRILLRQVVGFGAPPELLPHGLVEKIRRELVASWNAAEELLWQDAIASGVASEMLVALADYHRDPGLRDRALENLADHGN